MIALETDEHGHQGYDQHDEEIRYHDLYMVYSGKWIFIRFNPDNTLQCKVDLEDRIEILLDTMKTQIERVKNEENTELLEPPIKLFYPD